MPRIIKIKRNQRSSDKSKLKILLRSLPVSINNLYGDPFILAQAKNTFYKLLKLRKVKHQGPISIITKFNFNDEIIKRLSEFRDMKNLIFFYSLTGLNEGGVPFKQKIKAYMRLAATMPNVVLLFRPIIADKNDSPKMIQQMVGICRESKTNMVYTALYVKDNSKVTKDLKIGVEERIIHEAAKQGIKVFSKSACATQAILDLNFCYAHVNKKPRNLDLLKLFYSFKVENDVVTLKSGTRGDRNFTRFITRSNPKIINENKERFLSFTSFPILVSSSWFSWARITHCEINCSYCLIEIYPESIKPEEIGCEPIHLLKLIKEGD